MSVPVHVALESNCGTQVIAWVDAPIERLMTHCEADPGCAIEVHGFSCEDWSVLITRLRRTLAASGCCAVECRRRGRQRMECRFEVELDAAIELYCGLVTAGLELTELSHRVLTQMCVVRAHCGEFEQRARWISVRVVMSFIGMEDETELLQVMHASA